MGIFRHIAPDWNELIERRQRDVAAGQAMVRAASMEWPYSLIERSQHDEAWGMFWALSYPLREVLPGSTPLRPRGGDYHAYYAHGLAWPFADDIYFYCWAYGPTAEHMRKGPTCPKERSEWGVKYRHLARSDLMKIVIDYAAVTKDLTPRFDEKLWLITMDYDPSRMWGLRRCSEDGSHTEMMEPTH